MRPPRAKDERTRSLLKRIAILGPVAALALATFAACGSDDAGNDDAALNAINILDSAGLHGIDDSINAKKEIPASARTTALKLQALTKLASWPSDLEDEAQDLETIFAEMAAALDRDNPDLAKAGAAAAKAHDAEHEFSEKVWTHLYEEADIEAEEAAPE